VSLRARLMRRKDYHALCCSRPEGLELAAAALPPTKFRLMPAIVQLIWCTSRRSGLSLIVALCALEGAKEARSSPKKAKRH
jgi:hypothetical protein